MYTANYLPLKSSTLVASFPGHPGMQLVWNSHLYIIFGDISRDQGRCMASCLFQNCRSKNCDVCVSRIDSIVIRIDSIVIKIDSIVHKIDSLKKTDLMQNYGLDCVPRSTQYLLILPCSSQSFTIESIIQQLSRSFSNQVNLLMPTAATWHLTTPTRHVQ